MPLARKLLHALLLVLTLAIGTAVAVAIVTQTAWFKEWLRGYVVREANQYLNGTLEIGRLGGNLFFGFELENIQVSVDGARVVAVQDLDVRYNAFQWVTRGLSIDEVRLTSPVIVLRQEGDTWNVARLIKSQAQEADREGPGSPIAVDAIGISDASIVFDTPVRTPDAAIGTSGDAPLAVAIPSRIEHLDARLSFRYEPVRYSMTIDHVSFRTDDPALALNSLSGTIAVREDAVHVDRIAIRTRESSVSIHGAVQTYLTRPTFNLSVSSDALSMPEVGRLVPALAHITLQPAFELNAEGPLDRLGVSMDVRSAAGNVKGTLVADVSAPGQAVKGEVSVSRLDLSALSAALPRSDVSADISADVSGPSFGDVQTLQGGVSLRADRVEGAGYTLDRLHATASLLDGAVRLNAAARAYGVEVSADGEAVLPTEARRLSYDVSGAVRGLDLRRLPASLAAPRVETDINVRYHARGTEPQDDQDGAMARAVDAALTFEPSTLPGATLGGGSTARVALRDGQTSYAADASLLAADLLTLGHALAIPALQHERYRSALNVRLRASGRGTSAEERHIQASGALTDSTVLGGHVPLVVFTADVAGDRARVTAAGRFARFDPGLVSGDERARGAVAGTVDVDLELSRLTEITADSVAGNVKLTLEPSTVAGLTLERVSADVSYRDQQAEVRAFEVVGRDLNVTATGIVAISDAGQSNLSVHADSPRVQEIAGRFDVPVSGIARIDATVTGNRAALQFTGALTGNGVTYGEHGALSLRTQFSGAVPELDVNRATAEVETSATFVTLAGQNVNELRAVTTYHPQEVTFDVTARQPDREMTAGGALSLRPDRQELRLSSLGVQSRGVQLTLAPGAEATVRYGGEVVSVSDLRLTSGDADVSVEGTFGRPESSLRVTLANVDLGIVDALLLREPQLSGRFDATNTIGGTRDAPRVESTFSVSNGGFRQFRYDGLSGTLRYVPAGVTVDARLQQNASQWLTARGYLPAALFGRGAAGAGDAQDHRIDFAIDSSPIALGVVQGFTTALTNVDGTAEAHLRVTGTADRPEPDGVITVQDGALTVEPTGGQYRHIAAVLRLRPDRIGIEQLTVLDNHNSALSLTGDVALDEKRVSGIELYLNADDFKVVDNELGNVRLQSSLEMAGDLTAPRIGGYLGVTTGELNVDTILALVGSSPYATAPAPGSDEATPDDRTTAPGPYAASTIDVSLSIPDALVLKGSNLQAPGSPVGLGALIVTLGGELRATKKPGETIRLMGDVNTIRGTYDFQGRRFEILRDGAIRFVGLEELNPTLDVRTRRLIQGVEARVNIRGTVQKPEIELASTPPLEQADILSLIVFNQPINQLGEGQQTSLVARAQALATGAVAGQLAESIGNALNLDTFEIQVAPENGGGPQVTLGQQVGERLFVRLQQGVGAQSTTNLLLEYEVSDWLRLQTKLVQGAAVQPSLFQRNQGSGADLIFFFSY